MIIAMTGGSGFIGKRLVQRHLARGDTVRVLTRNPSGSSLPEGVEFFTGDLTLAETRFDSFVDGADVLYHCAAELRDVSRMEAVNVLGTQRLIPVASKRVRRWVQLSSVGAYGPVRQGIITEQSPEQPSGPYEVTKTQADALVRQAAANGAFEAVLLRPSIVYGEGMPNRSLYQWLAMIEHGLFFFMGPEGASANYIHVDDVVAALELCATHPHAAGDIFNLSDWCTIEELASIFTAALGRPALSRRLPLAPIRLLAAIFGRIPGFPLTSSRVDALTNRVRYPSTHIEKELDFSLQVPMKEGMTRLADAWKASN